MENLEILINELIRYPDEAGWLEFKVNNCDPKMIGQNISALANTAALEEKSCAYMVWGVDDKTHEIVGTDFHPQRTKKGSQEIENWLRGMLSKNAEFEFSTIKMDDKDLVLLIICRAMNQTVLFEHVDYIRVGSYTKKLNDYPTIQAKLWDRLRTTQYEDMIAKQDLEPDDALQLIDYSAYFELKQERQPTNQSAIMHYMIEEGIVVLQDNGLYGISNMGAILFSKNLSAFPRIARKGVRVVQYKGNDRLNMLKEDFGGKGYAVGFKGLIQYIEALLPTEEVIQGAFREKKSAYPSVAIREAVANALIHQDFSITGTSPLIEIFDRRVEITNPGQPLVDIKRIVDNPPKSRNEKLAALMRRLRMCEELGTGWDKIVTQCELGQLPAPKIQLYGESTRVTLYSEVPFTNISMEDRVWACYLHACIRQVSGEYLTNSSLRERFGVQDSSAGSISRLIKETVERKFIKPLDPDTAPRYMKYIPFWA